MTLAKKREIILWVTAALVLTGCAVNPVYRKQGFQTHGYKDTKIQDDIFSITFKGKVNTREKDATRYALLRCAEVTLENGYTYFAVLEEKSATNPVQPKTYMKIKCFKEEPNFTSVRRPVYDARIEAAALTREYLLSD